MSFLAPFQLLWLSLIVPVVALHMLKKKRLELKVSSTFLWQGALRDVHANKPFRRLIPRISLLLQILAILCGAFALARPQLGQISKPGERLCLVIDVSSSMLARSGGVSRVQEARESALAIATSLAPGSQVMVIAAGATPELLSTFESDEERLETALGNVQVRGNEAAINEAVALASSRVGDSGRVIVFTDGVFDGDIPGAGETAVEYRLVGRTGENAGITDASARLREGDASLFVVVTFAGSTEDRDAFLSVQQAIPGPDGALLDTPILASRRVTLSPERDTPVRLRVPMDRSAQAGLDGAAQRGDNSLLRVTLSHSSPGSPDASDSLPEDDEIIVAVGAEVLPVVLYGNTNSYLARALQLDPHVDLFRATEPLSEGIRPEVLARRPLFVFTGEVPDVAPPGDSIVLGDLSGEVFEATYGEVVESPRIVSWIEGDERMRFLRLDAIPLGKSRVLEGAAPLIRGLDGPVAGTVTRPDGETLFLPFSLSDGRWPTDPSFVVFFRNVVERARVRRGAGGLPAATLGEPIQLSTTAGDEVLVQSPSGWSERVEASGELTRVALPPESGVFVVDIEGRKLVAVRSLLSRSESRLARRNLEDLNVSIAEAESTPQDLWWLFALLLIALLTVELLWATRKAPWRLHRNRTGGSGGNPELSSSKLARTTQVQS